MRTRIAMVMMAAAIGTWAQTPAKLKEFVIEPVEATGSHHNSLSNTEVTADRVVLRDLIGFVYRASSVRVQGPGWLDDTYSVKARAQPGEEDQFLSALQRALLDRLHLRVEHASKDMPVYVLKMTNPDAPKMNQGSGAPTMSGGNGSLSVVNVPMSEFDDFLTGTFGRPVVDETGRSGVAVRRPGGVGQGDSRAARPGVDGRPAESRRAVSGAAVNLGQPILAATDF
jgi:hypothetical protein